MAELAELAARTLGFIEADIVRVCPLHGWSLRVEGCNANSSAADEDGGCDETYTDLPKRGIHGLVVGVWYDRLSRNPDGEGSA